MTTSEHTAELRRLSFKSALERFFREDYYRKFLPDCAAGVHTAIRALEYSQLALKCLPALRVSIQNESMKTPAPNAPARLGVLPTLLVEDNERLRPAMQSGLESTREIQVVGAVASGEDALDFCLHNARPGAVLMDVHLAGELNGLQAAIAIRREFPRLPIVFYSIQDEDEYYRAFRRSGILSHYAYVKKSNYLLPQMIVPLLKDAADGRSFIDPDIETRVLEVRHKDEHAPLDLLEPNEREVAKMLARGMTNEQIATKMGFRDKRTISRVNGQIYTSWGLNDSTTDEKVARTRAALIYRAGRLLEWKDDGTAQVQNENGEWISWD